MSRNQSRRRPTTKEIIEELGVEDDAINYLAKLPDAIAAVTSVRVAMQFADLWKAEHAAMIRRGDPRLAYQTTDEERDWLAAAVAVSSKSLSWWTCPHEQLGKLFGKVTPDVAAYIAYRVAKYACWEVDFS
ncbi:hypothetical protein ABIB83_002760 [Bradyrhizobium sp. I1.8.5]|uniref:hypothetical protein n=1 Tax=Bradyrhizobium sp. I1.8.5 TaxID=3156365 RepID=UPI00339AEE4B